MPYFDHNATSPICPVARIAWLRATEEFIGNPSSPHRVGRRAERALEDARETLAGILGCSAAAMVWTSGATESVNTAIHHLAAPGGEAWISAIEHPCVIESATVHFGERVRFIPALPSGVIDLTWLERQLERRRPALVAVMAANNETGSLQPWRATLDLCQRFSVPLLCDASQWIGKLPAAGLGECDFVAGCAHKFGGPQGVGFLKGPSNFRALLVGGGQEEGRRAGTENVAGVLAQVAALVDREGRLQREEHLVLGRDRAEFVHRLQKHLGNIQIVGAEDDALWNTVSIVMPEVDCRHRWIVKLDKLGFAVSTGSACASGREKPSHVLSALGMRANVAARVLRISSGWETTSAEWEQLLGAFQTAHREMLDQRLRS